MNGFVIAGDKVVWHEHGKVHTGEVQSVSDDGCWCQILEDGTQDTKELPVSILEHQAF